MLIDYDFLLAIKDNPEWLKGFVKVHNNYEEAYGNNVILIAEYFEEHANNLDYDIDYLQSEKNIKDAREAYNKFIKEVKRHLFVPSQE